MMLRTVLILGGSGFVGRALLAKLVRAQPGLRLRVPSRRPARTKALAMLPGVELIEADVHDPATLARLVQGCDAVVNLVAILHGSAARFEAVHVQLPQRLVEACRAAATPHLLHVSALGVPDDPAQAPSLYLRSKARGEAVLRAGGVPLTLLRPSVIYGAEDRFINLFAALQAVMPVMALAGAQARFQPVWVEDVAQALLQCLQAAPPAAPQTFEAAGPKVWTLAQIVRAAGVWSGHPRRIVPLPEAIGRLQAGLLGLLPGEPLMSADNLDSMRLPNVASGRLPGLAELGIRPSALESVMPELLRRGPQPLDLLRALARRD
ncbi:MAG: hypothetical protein RJA44_2254 [Pseudomonadota bacterium]